MAKRRDELDALWSDLDVRIRTAARLIVAKCDMMDSADHEDLAQSTMADLYLFVGKIRAADPAIAIDELRRRAIGHGKVALKHNFLDLVRKRRRHHEAHRTLGALSSEASGFVDSAWRRQTTPEERAIALDFVDKMLKRTKSKPATALLDALRQVVRNDIRISPVDLTDLAKVSSADLCKFRDAKFTYLLCTDWK